MGKTETGGTEMMPMQKIAENHIRITKSLFREGMRAVGNQEYRHSIRKLSFFLSAIFAIAAVWLLSTGGSLVFLLGEAVFLGALLFWLFIMLPGTRLRSKYKAMMHPSGKAPERTTIFYPEHISVTAENGKETIIPYSHIRSWKETKRLYILNRADNTSVLLDKQGFASGSFHTIKSLLP